MVVLESAAAKRHFQLKTSARYLVFGFPAERAKKTGTSERRPGNFVIVKQAFGGSLADT